MMLSNDTLVYNRVRPSQQVPPCCGTGNNMSRIAFLNCRFRTAEAVSLRFIALATSLFPILPPVNQSSSNKCRPLRCCARTCSESCSATQ
jgi:hypothetical protein